MGSYPVTGRGDEAPGAMSRLYAAGTASAAPRDAAYPAPSSIFDRITKQADATRLRTGRAITEPLCRREDRGS
jgi:hypothetical protein